MPQELTYADHCEEQVPEFPGAIVLRDCKGKGLVVVVHPDKVTRKVLCGQHSRKAYMSGYLVDWDETLRVFGTGRPKDKLASGIDRGQWRSPL